MAVEEDVRRAAGGAYQLDMLASLLESAVDLLRQLSDDPMLSRLVKSYASLPREDRAFVAGVLEREVAFRLTTLNGGDRLSGFGARANPNARLYLRVVQAAPERVPSLSHDDIVYSSVRSARIMKLVLSPNLYDRWRAATAEAFGILEDEDRRAVRAVVSELLAILDRVEIADREPARGD